MNSIRFFALSLLIVSSAHAHSSPCPLSQGSAMALSGAAGAAAGLLTYKAFHTTLSNDIFERDPFFARHGRFHSSMEKVLPWIVFGIFSGVSYAVLSRWTPEYQYEVAEKVIFSLINDPLVRADVTSVEFFKEVDRCFIGTNWPLVEAYEFVSDALLATHASAAVLSGIIKECPGESYRELREQCGNLLRELRDFDDRAEAAMFRLAQHERFNHQQARKKECYEREVAENRRITERNKTISSGLDIANGVVKLCDNVKRVNRP